MMTRLFAIVLLLLLFLLSPFAAHASETRTIDAYTVTVGFSAEPAIQGDTNGVRIRVLKGNDPVTGVESTLHVTVGYADEQRELPLVATEQPGVYTSTFIPLQAGGYTFNLTGTIGDAQVKESFSSGKGIPNVELRSMYEFPTTAHGFTGHAAMPFALGMATAGAGLLITRMRRTTHPN